MRDINVPPATPTTPTTPPATERDREALDHEKRLRREIANSNERRRMQSINAGFQSLRNLLPHHEGEKLSKAAILQQTAEYIHQLEQEKSRLMAQNSQLMKRFNNGSTSSSATAQPTGATAVVTASQPNNNNNNGEASSSNIFASPHSPTGETPPAIIKRRKTLDGSVESADEGIGSMSPDHNGEEYRNEVQELRRETMGLRIQLERERRHRLSLEDNLSTLRQQHHQQEQQQQLPQHQHHLQPQTLQQQQQEQVIEQSPQIVYVQQQQAPQQTATVQLKYEHERMQTVEENEVYHRVSTPARNSYDDYRVRHNLNSIVEAIRQLEGDHLFADDRAPARTTVSPPSTQSPRAMETCSPSPNHHGVVSQVAPPVQSAAQYAHCSSEVPLALTSTVIHQEPQHQQSSAPITLRPAYQTSTTVIPVSTTVTSLKHHVLNRLARSGEMEEPINLEYRRTVTVSRTPSPPLCLQQPQQQQQHHHLQQQQPSQTVTQFHIQQQQLRPGVIVVKHS